MKNKWLNTVIRSIGYMSIEIPKNIHGISPQNLNTTPAVSTAIKPQSPQSVVPQKINRDPVDYSTLPRSESVHNSRNIQFNDKDITEIVRVALAQEQKSFPTGLKSKYNLTSFQSDIAQSVQKNGHPTPRALLPDSYNPNYTAPAA